MDIEEKVKGNNLIAEFMGYSFDGRFWFKNGRRLAGLFYHSDWNMIMKAVDKICDEKQWSINSTMEWLSEEFDLDGLYTIEHVFKAVVLFIESKNKELCQTGATTQ